jgi:hypothetical protein
MRIWLACFFVLFAIAELFDWIKHLSLPLPIYILGGAFLAIASNSNKTLGLFFFNSSAEPPTVTNADTYQLNLSSEVQQASPDSKTLSKHC